MHPRFMIKKWRLKVYFAQTMVSLKIDMSFSFHSIQVSDPWQVPKHVDKGWECSCVVGHSPNVWEALGPNPSTQKNINKA